MSQEYIAICMSDLSEVLDRLGLSQYLDRLALEGFNDWETVLDITESDLSSLGFKLGHRRRLQREIARCRGIHEDEPLPLRYLRSHSEERVEDFEDEKSPRSSSKAIPSGKRKYRRHPKGDDFAPKKPPSAYVSFASDIRDQVKPQNLSFAEIAKNVGERWKALDPEVRSRYDDAATSAKEEYNRELLAYKQTDQYAAHQRYLIEFKSSTKNDPSDASKKRPRLGTSNVSIAESESLQGSSASKVNRLVRRQDTTTMTDSSFRSPRASSVNSSGSEFGSDDSEGISETFMQEEVTSSLAQHTISTETSQPSKSIQERRQSGQSTNQMTNVLNCSDTIIRTSQTQLEERSRSRSHTRPYSSGPEPYLKPGMHNQMPYSQVQPVLSHSRGSLSPGEASVSYSRHSPHTPFPSKIPVGYNDPFSKPVLRTSNSDNSPSTQTGAVFENDDRELLDSRTSRLLNRSLPPLSTAVPLGSIGQGSPYHDRGYARDKIPVLQPIMSRKDEKSPSRTLPALNRDHQSRQRDQQDQDADMEGNDRMNTSF